MSLSTEHRLDLDRAVQNLELKLQALVDPDAHFLVAPGQGLKVALMGGLEPSPPSDLDPDPDVIAELPSSHFERWWIARPEGTIVIGRPYVDKDPFCCECNAEINHLDSVGLYCRSAPICPNCALRYHDLLANIAALVNSVGPVLGTLAVQALGAVASRKKEDRDGSSPDETEAESRRATQTATDRPQGPVWLGD